MFGENQLIYNWRESERETQIYVKSQSCADRCVICGQTSEKNHATYTRSIQIIPMGRKTTYAKVIATNMIAAMLTVNKKYSWKRCRLLYPPKWEAKNSICSLWRVRLFWATKEQAIRNKGKQWLDKKSVWCNKNRRRARCRSGWYWWRSNTSLFFTGI